MQFKAEYTRLVVQESTHLACPPRIRRIYENIIRVGAILVAVPSLLILLTCIFHIPLLPLLMMLVLVAVLNRMVTPVAQAAVAVLWPLHSRWLLRHQPERVYIQKQRKVTLHRDPTQLAVDAHQGRLRLGMNHRDLVQPHKLRVEFSQDQGPQLRVRIQHPNKPPLVLGAALPRRAQELLEEELEQLPRLEGEAALLSWEDFRLFLSILQQIEAPTEHTFSPLLARLAARDHLPEEVAREAIAAVGTLP
jgi:hypothetical protein